MRSLFCATMFLTLATAAGAQTCAVPGPASVAGYDTETYGAPLVVGSTPNPQTSYPQFINGANIVPFDFYGTSWTNIGFTNSGGTVTLNGSGEAYGNGLATASVTPTGQTLNGIAFGGGGYFQVTMAGNGPMSFWMNDYEKMNSASVGASDPNPSWIEDDIAEFDSTGVYGFAIHNWHDDNTSEGSDSGSLSGSPASPPGANYTQPNQYGFLWVPATATSQGQASFFFNGVQVGNTLVWNQYVPGQSAPSNPFAVMDVLHMIPILGTGPGTNITFSNLQVWQKSSANDIGTLVTAGSVQTPCSETATAAATATQDPTPAAGSATDSMSVSAAAPTTTAASTATTTIAPTSVQQNLMAAYALIQQAETANTAINQPAQTPAQIEAFLAQATADLQAAQDAMVGVGQP